MEEQNEKACLIEEHDSPCITLMCIDKDCKLKSRTICQECMCSSQQNHKNCTTFVQFADRAQNKLKLKNKEKFDLNKILKSIQEYEEDILGKVEEELDDFMKNLAQKISGIKKNLKIQILQQYQDIKTKIQESQNAQQETEQQFAQLGEEWQKFREQTISIQTLNQQLEKLQKSQTNQDVLKQIEKDYSNIKPFDIKTFKFDYLKDECEKLVQDYETREHDLKVTTNLSLKEIIPFKSYQQYFKTNQDGSYEVINSYCQMRFKNSFSKNDHIQFKFRVNFPQVQYFHIGVCANEHANIESGCQWSTTGNYYGLHNCLKFKQAKESTGKKAAEVFKDGQIYVVEICIRDNLFKVSDIGQEWSITNEYSFEKQYEDWAITIQMYQGLIQIL